MKTFKYIDSLHNVNWPVPDVLAFTSTKEDPFTSNPFLTLPNENACYGAFNLGLHVGDDADQVALHRDNIERNILPDSKIQWLNQVHGNSVAEVMNWREQPIEADAAITRNPHVALAVMTADCLPILITNESGTEVAAIHGGWRPLAQNIIANTVSKMVSNSGELYAWLGPCIGRHAFEVGSEVKKQFKMLDDKLSEYFHHIGNKKYYANLQGIANHLLHSQGIERISALEECTFTMENKYYSYRRNSKTGRMASIVAMQPRHLCQDR